MHTSSRGRARALVASTVLALGAALAGVATAPSATAADPVTINLLGINDFHGRIDANTVKWAGTVEQLATQAVRGRPTRLLVGAGDLIGASLFASAVANGPADDRRAERARPRRLGRGQPRVRQGLGRPARPGHRRDRQPANADVGLPRRERLPEGHHDAGAAGVRDRTTIDGVTVGVIGAVTEETPSLVSPGGITDLDFGDPVAAVNRVAGAAQRRQPAQRRGRRHRRGVPRRRQRRRHRATRRRRSPRAASSPRWRNLDPARRRDLQRPHPPALRRGTHPVPGGDRPTRPIVQTGEYGEQRRPGPADRRPRHR